MSRGRAEITEFLTNSIGDVAGSRLAGKPISAGSNLLDDLGLDSLEYATVLLSCERWLGIRIIEQGIDWSSLSTVGSLAVFLESQQDTRG
ncbi:hypothetical protein K8I85_06915 [bacterium]|nr:hypothetical protein [bacterium]